MYRVAQCAFVAVVLGGLATPCLAHFPWLSTDEEGRAMLYFAESPLKADYHMPDTVAKATVMQQKAKGDPTPVELEAVDTKDFVGRKSEPGAIDEGVLTTICHYGNYHGTLLSYYAKHYAGELGAALKSETQAPPQGFELDARPSLIDDGIALTITRDGKPVENASVTVIDSQGEQAEKETAKDGSAKFFNLAAGKLGFIVGVTEKATGEVDGESYTSKSYYLTLTVDTSIEGPSATEADDPAMQSALPLLPQPIASFGAAVCDGYVYVYSGHTGTAHDHSRENLSQHFCRVPIEGGEWQSLPLEQSLQGFPLVPHNGILYRVGGMQATNDPDDEEDLHSVDTFAAFDPATKQWTNLPPLPEPRSSHDAVVIEGWLYVVGGWELSGSSEGQWHQTAWKIDLENMDEGWQQVATPPFNRRALAVSHVGNTLVAIGGIDEAGDISRQVDALDLDTGEWSALPELPGDGMQGFGVSAWNHQGTLYVSGSSGVVLRWGSDRTWHEAAKLADRRFFHRLLPAGDDRLLIIGGASIDRESHTADSHWVKLKPGA